MPSAPQDAFQLLVILLFLLPGIVFQFSRTVLRGPAPDDASATTRLLRALTVSTLLAIAYAIVLGGRLTALLQSAAQTTTGQGGSVTALALWALALLFAVPVLVALADHLTLPLRRRWSARRLAYDPTPSAWDFAFNDPQPCYIRVLLTDGRYVGGWFGGKSFVSSYPEPHDLFIEKAHKIDEEGRLSEEIAGSAGVWVPCDQIMLLEMLEPDDTAHNAAPEAQEGGPT